MLDEAIKTKLRDSAYLDWHLAAVHALKAVGSVPWYDSHFLRRLEVAKQFLDMVNPAALDQFVSGFEPLKPRPDFTATLVEDLFDAETRERIVAITGGVKADAGDPSRQGQWERENFGRRVVWDHPYFLELQQRVLPLVSEVAGCRLRTGYNFLSLYGAAGRCQPHMDEPYSMYTLDYCIAQNHEWPIHFSRVVEWPTIETFRSFDAEALKHDPALGFAPQVMQPGQAIVFNGSSQWHYRDDIPAGGFCDLLFFHYYPEGCEDLVEPRRWAAYFDIPELVALCDLFEREPSPEAH